MINGTKVRLREKKLSDARDDYTWQTDSEMARLDATTALRISFEEYLVEYSYLLNHPAGVNRHFSVEIADGKHIGNCGYYNIDAEKGEAEMGIMIGDRSYWDRGYGTDAVRALLDHIFRETAMDRVHLKTLDWNFRAQRSFVKSGFKSCGYLSRDGNIFVLMEITRAQWQAQRIDRDGEAAKLRADRVAGQ
ncbi:MAG: GNAT family N-acetyltransferase [Dehalococcoidales bacterium]|nr:GNAT family N-acetyltransferase [Dehalococcoidales bacterium]